MPFAAWLSPLARPGARADGPARKAPHEGPEILPVLPNARRGPGSGLRGAANRSCPGGTVQSGFSDGHMRESILTRRCPSRTHIAEDLAHGHLGGRGPGLAVQATRNCPSCTNWNLRYMQFPARMMRFGSEHDNESTGSRPAQAILIAAPNLQQRPDTRFVDWAAGRPGEIGCAPQEPRREG